MRFLLSTLLALAALTSASAQKTRLVLQAGELIDGKGAVLHNQQIVVEDGHIVSVGPGTAKPDYDLSSLTLMPGWIDTHVHLQWHMNAQGRPVADGPPDEMVLYDEADSWLSLQGGFTTVESVGSKYDKPVRDRINEGVLPGPRVYTMTYEQIDAVCSEAKAVGLRSVVHAIGDAGARDAVKAGCTSIEHGTFLTDETLKLMVARGTYFDPNLLVLHNYLDHRTSYTFTDAQLKTIEAGIKPTQDVLRRARALGVKIVFGTR